MSANKTQQFTAQQKLVAPLHDTPVKLAPADKVAAPIKQEYPALVSTYTGITGNRELEWSDPYSVAHRKRKIEVTIESDVENPAEPLTFVKAEPDASQSSLCLRDAQLLWRSSTAAQSHQFPFLIKELRNYLFARAHLSPNEAQAIAEAIEIAAFIGMNPEAVKPNDPALADLLIAIDHLQAFAGELVPLQVSKYVPLYLIVAPTTDWLSIDSCIVPVCRNINRCTAYLLATATATAAEVALGEPYIVQHGEDTVIRVNV